eukprot:COSAG01_NODE_45380_length_409_cov_58.774194_1_plen_40_part_10
MLVINLKTDSDLMLVSNLTSFCSPAADYARSGSNNVSEPE